MIPSRASAASNCAYSTAQMKEHGIGSGQIVRRKEDGLLEYQRDDLTVEEPLEIRIGRKTLATTMRTPGHDEELAAGFLVSEGIARKAEQIAKISHPADSANRENIIVADIAGGVKLKLSSAKRLERSQPAAGFAAKPASPRFGKIFLRSLLRKTFGSTSELCFHCLSCWKESKATSLAPAESMPPGSLI
jgi:formate dehydrogenase assembly factor FdhD